MSSTGALDKFILDAVDSSWQKVAMIVAKALTDQDLDLPESMDDAEFVAAVFGYLFNPVSLRPLVT